MRIRNSSLTFLITLAAAATCAAAPPLEVAATYTARDLELLRLISEQSTSFKGKTLTSKVEKAALTSDTSLIKKSIVNEQTGAAAAEIYEVPVSSSGGATHYEVQMPIPRLQSQNAQNPSMIAAQTKSLEVRIASDLENRSRRIIVEERTIEMPNGDRYTIEQLQSVGLNTNDFQFVSSSVTKGSASRSVEMEKNGILEVRFKGPNDPIGKPISFNPSAQKNISDFLALNPGAKLESSFATFEGSGLILVYRDSRGQRFEFSYDLSSAVPKFRYFAKQLNGTDPSIAVHQIAGRKPYSSKDPSVRGMTTQEFLATRRAGGSF